MDLFSNIVDFENLHTAYLDARRYKRYRSSIVKFGYALEENLLSLRRELLNKTYRHGGYREFIVNDSKKRLIKAAPFRDRVVHHAVCNIIEPIFEPGFIYDSYACRQGKGSHAAVKRLEKFVQSLKSRERERESRNATRIYCLKCDISKFFDNIDHVVLLEILGKKIADKKILWLLDEIITSNPRGIPIGNLTSQLFANIYMNELDHFVKRELGERYYVRYMDDFLILGTDKNHLREIKERISVFLGNRLKLTLHPKKAEIFPIDRGIDFLGYVLFSAGIRGSGSLRLLRKSTVKRFLKKQRRYKAMVQHGKMTPEFYENIRASWRGYAMFGNSYKLMKKLGLLKVLAIVSVDRISYT